MVAKLIPFEAPSFISRNLIHPQQNHTYVGRINFAIAVHVANAKHRLGVDHVEQDRHVAFVNHAVEIKVAGAQLTHVGHAVVMV